LYASSRDHRNLYPPTISGKLGRSESPHQAYHKCWHSARRFPHPMRNHQAMIDIEAQLMRPSWPWHRAITWILLL
jgi:hypothetical protein